MLAGIGGGERSGRTKASVDDFFLNFFYVIDIFVFLFLRRGGRRIGWSVWVLREGESCKGPPFCFQKEGQLWGLLSLYVGGVR